MRARGVLLVLLALACGAAGAAAQEALDADALARALASAPHADDARAFYASRGARPLWTAPTREDPAALTDYGRGLLAALRDAAADGLNPTDYPLPSSSASPEAREAALTASFLRLYEHLLRGRVAPTSAHRDWRAQRRPLDARAALRTAAAEGPRAALADARPPHEGYAHLRLALAALRARAGTPWEPLAAGPVLREGDRGPRVAALRQRLLATGDLAPSPATEVFDAAVDAAVRRAQARFGISVDGAVGPTTLAALNVTPEARARQVALNMERWRWLPADLGTRHVWIDAAGMTAVLVERGAPTWSARAIVGTRQTPTPGFTSVITDVVLSPYWNIPASIARAEIWPRVRRDPGYLARHHMERLSNGTLRQRPGPDNPLGPVKFIFETPFGVRLHGTSNPALFERSARAFSHGCIRAEEPLALADRLLPEWDAGRIAEAVAEGREQWVRLETPVPIHVTYWTARADAGGALSFSPDVYGRDRALAAALP